MKDNYDFYDGPTAKRRSNRRVSGKVIIPIVLFIGIFIGVVVVLQTKGMGASVLTEGKKIFFPIASEPDADPDNDGLKNWEEDMHKTDPRDPDTDNDGYMDGEEVLSGYNPTIPAPNDALEGTDTTIPRPAPGNLTTFLAQILASKIQSGEIKPIQSEDTAPDSSLLNNEDILNEALTQIAEKAEKYFVLPNISDSDIKISSKQTTTEEVSSYMIQMQLAMQIENPVMKKYESEADVIAQAVQTKDVKDVARLVIFYDENIKNLKNVEAPKDFINIHKEQIAIFELTKKILEAVRDFENDPATASAATEKYIDLKDIIKNFSDKLTEQISAYAE